MFVLNYISYDVESNKLYGNWEHIVVVMLWIRVNFSSTFFNSANNGMCSVGICAQHKVELL